jgi:hypothetical protein
MTVFESWFKISTTFTPKRGKKLTELAHRVQSLVDNQDLGGIENFVLDLKVECQSFIRNKLRAKFPPYDFRIVNSAEYSAILGRITVQGIPIPPIYYQTQAITIATSPILVLLDIQKLLGQATGETPAVSFSLVLILALMEELLHVLHFSWEHERIHSLAGLATESFVGRRLPKGLLASLSNAV